MCAAEACPLREHKAYCDRVISVLLSLCPLSNDSRLRAIRGDIGK